MILEWTRSDRTEMMFLLQLVWWSYRCCRLSPHCRPRRLSCAGMACSFKYIRAGHVRSASLGHIRTVDSQAARQRLAAGLLWQNASDGVFNIMNSPRSDVATVLFILGLCVLVVLAVLLRYFLAACSLVGNGVD